MDVANYYRSVLADRSKIAEACLADSKSFALQVSSHNLLKDLDTLHSLMGGPEKAIFAQGCREYQYSLEAPICGSYRHAFSSLRLAFELFLATIYFSGHQMKMHLWLSGHDDLVWAVINDNDKGVFSHTFVQAFNSELRSYRMQYLGLASTVFRECSEYVHGNPSTHDDTSVRIGFDAKRHANFHDKIDSMWICILFAFVVRYLRDLLAEDKTKIELLVLGSFGDIPEIQAAFGGGGE